MGGLIISTRITAYNPLLIGLAAKKISTLIQNNVIIVALAFLIETLLAIKHSTKEFLTRGCICLLHISPLSWLERVTSVVEFVLLSSLLS